MHPKQEHQFKAPSHVAGAAAAPPAVVSPAPLTGTWTNTNKATRDIVKIVIAASGGGISVEAFGACSPTPCDWGSVPGIVYAATVSASKATAFSAQYKFSFGQATIAGHLHEGHLLIQTFTQFTDGSGRSNLFTTDQLAK